MFDAAAIRAQRGLAQVQGKRHAYFAGSYCGNGFHEDALSVGLAVAAQLGSAPSWERAPAGNSVDAGLPSTLVPAE